MLRSITPVPVYRSPRALSLTHQKESAVFTPPRILRSMIKSYVPLKTRLRSLNEVYAVFVGSPAVTTLALPLDAANCRGRVRITRSPNTAHTFVHPKKKLAHVFKEVYLQTRNFSRECQKRQ